MITNTNVQLVHCLFWSFSSNFFSHLPIHDIEFLFYHVTLVFFFSSFCLMDFFDIPNSLGVLFYSTLFKVNCGCEIICLYLHISGVTIISINMDCRKFYFFSYKNCPECLCLNDVVNILIICFIEFISKSLYSYFH